MNRNCTGNIHFFTGYALSIIGTKVENRQFFGIKFKDCGIGGVFFGAFIAANSGSGAITPSNKLITKLCRDRNSFGGGFAIVNILRQFAADRPCVRVVDNIFDTYSCSI